MKIYHIWQMTIWLKESKYITQRMNPGLFCSKLFEYEKLLHISHIFAHYTHFVHFCPFKFHKQPVQKQTSNTNTHFSKQAMHHSNSISCLTLLRKLEKTFIICCTALNARSVTSYVLLINRQQNLRENATFDGLSYRPSLPVPSPPIFCGKNTANLSTVWHSDRWPSGERWKELEKAAIVSSIESRG